MVVWRVDTVTTGSDGAPYYTGLFFTDAAGSVSQARQAVVDFWTDLASVIANDFTMTVQGTVYEVDTATDTVIGTLSAGANVAVLGTNAGAPLANATQGLIRWRTGNYIGGRELRGRTFIPGPTTGDVENGGPDAGYVTALNTAAQNFIDDPNSVPHIYSRVNHTNRAIESGDAWTEFAVLRSRRD